MPLPRLLEAEEEGLKEASRLYARAQRGPGTLSPSLFLPLPPGLEKQDAWRSKPEKPLNPKAPKPLASVCNADSS